MHPVLIALSLLLAAGCLAAVLAADLEPIDLRRAVVLTAEDASPLERRAAQMLVEEVERRTLLRWPILHDLPHDDRPLVVLGREPLLDRMPGEAFAAVAAEKERPGPEGYRIRTLPGEPIALLVLGADERGTLYGAGCLLRKLETGGGKARLPSPLHLTTTPHYPLRGHQLGYRPKTNSYDGWSLPMWEQYYRDLICFGANAVELIPPRSDDDADSPHFPLPPMETMVGMSRLADDYGLDVWIWYPALDHDYSDPATVEFALKEWGDVFRRLPRVDAVFVPGGDPGHTHPRHLLALLERQAANLRRFHPRGQMWVSPQSFSGEWLDEFVRILKEDRPKWLAGVVYGPQTRLPLPELRALVPARYPIRHYPDITHTLRCQYPVPDWDTAFALTLHREPINPRPRAMARIFRTVQPHAAAGFLTYSEGCNDDVNKAVWSALGWDPDADLDEILRDYARCYVSGLPADRYAAGLLMLEQNWDGPLAENESVDVTLHHLQALESEAGPAVLTNWRFQQALYRAYYDACVRARLRRETAQEAAALSALREARQTGALPALDAAERALRRAPPGPAESALRARVFELAEALFQSIRMQLSVPRYRAIAVGRGANLDLIDTPLNDRPWLLRRFAAIRALPDDGARLAGIREIVGWIDPGPGGFYDDLGDPARRPHLVPGPGPESDPAHLRSPLTGFAPVFQERRSWSRHAETHWDVPLQLRYAGLEPGARYGVRVIYGSESTRGKLRLDAGDGVEVHSFIDKPPPGSPVEFDVPPAAIRDGKLLLTFRQEPGLGGNGRGCQVSEVWLIRTAAAGE